jgi:hypothetical protein
MEISQTLAAAIVEILGIHLIHRVTVEILAIQVTVVAAMAAEEMEEEIAVAENNLSYGRIIRNRHIFNN